jgi:N-acetyl-anhydromuramoyl-L-alanine amidase
MILGPDGRMSGCRYVESPNHDERPRGEPVTLLVVHSISLPPGEYGGDSIERFFTNCLDSAAHPYFHEIHALKVSSHFLIRRDGQLVQFVPTTRRAWHAGASTWRGRSRCNDFSIGVELEGVDDAPFADVQYEVLVELIGALRARHPLRDFAAHSDIAPGRKTDPGTGFDWARLQAALAQHHNI